jgi:hypothetical protein
VAQMGDRVIADGLGRKSLEATTMLGKRRGRRLARLPDL